MCCQHHLLPLHVLYILLYSNFNKNQVPSQSISPIIMQYMSVFRIMTEVTAVKEWCCLYVLRHSLNEIP